MLLSIEVQSSKHTKKVCGSVSVYSPPALRLLREVLTLSNSQSATPPSSLILLPVNSVMINSVLPHPAVSRVYSLCREHKVLYSPSMLRTVQLSRPFRFHFLSAHLLVDLRCLLWTHACPLTLQAEPSQCGVFLECIAEHCHSRVPKIVSCRAAFYQQQCSWVRQHTVWLVLTVEDQDRVWCNTENRSE